MWPAVAVLAVTAIVFASRLLPWLAARVVSLYLGVGKVRWDSKYLSSFARPNCLRLICPSGAAGRAAAGEAVRALPLPPAAARPRCQCGQPASHLQRPQQRGNQPPHIHRDRGNFNSTCSVEVEK